MIGQGAAPVKAGQASAAAPIARPGGDHRIVAGTEIYLGVISAEALRAENLKPSAPEAAMHNGIPSGKGYYHVNVSLFDSKTGAPIADAHVKATVSDPVMGGETRTLELMARTPQLRQLFPDFGHQSPHHHGAHQETRRSAGDYRQFDIAR